MIIDVMTEKKLTAALMLIVFSLLVLAVPTAVLQAPAVAQINADTTAPTLDVKNREGVLYHGSEGSLVLYDVKASDIVDGFAVLNSDGTITQDEIGGDIIISCNPPSGSVLYPPGDHTVQCSATDSAGNSAQASFTIKVRSLPAGGGDPRTLKAVVSASPANYEGPCPVTITFTATITGVGPADFSYRWTDSDGYLGSTIGSLLIADVAETSRTWELGDINDVPSFQGWMALEIVEPVQLYSNVAWVSITCTSAIPAGATDREVPTLTQSGGVEINQLADNTASVGYRVTAQDDVDGSATLDANNVLTQDGRGGVITISCNPPSGSVLPIGDHTVQCSATDSVGRKGTISFPVSVTGPSATTTTPGLSATPAAVDTSFTVDINADGTTTTGPAPFTFQASASVSGGTSPYTYSWDFGDGQTSNEVSTQHQFQQPGTYNVALTVTDANGNTASDSIAVTVSAADAAAADAATTTTAPEEDTTTTDEEGGAATGGEGTDPEPTDETTTTDEEEEGAADDSGGGGPDGGESQ